MSVRRAEVWYAKTDIGRNNSDQGDVRDIVPLGNHLRTDENIELPFAETVENLLELALPREVSRSMRAIRAVGKCWCSSSSTFSDPTPMNCICSLPHLGLARYFLSVVAVMAQHTPIAAMVGQGH